MADRRARTGHLTGWRAGLVWAVVGVDLTLTIARFVGAPLGTDMPPWAVALFTAMVASFGVVGAVLVSRQPRNPVSWILWASATTLALSIASDLAVYLATTGLGTPPWILLMMFFGSFGFVLTIGLVVVFVPMLFPDGRLLSPRWRWVVAVSVVALVIAVLPSMFRPGPLPNAPTILNPLGIPGFERLKPLLDAANVLLVAVVFPLAMAASVLRYRRGTSVERQQLKWFAAAVSATALSFVAATTPVDPLSEVGWGLGLIGLTTLPIAIGLAILRYRLYDIDRIISRTIGYLIVTGVLAAVFVGAVLAFQAILAPVIGKNPVAVAASTLIVAALFQPLRRRVQRVVDRRFDRARYDAELTTAAFSERLRDQVDLPTLATDLDATVRTAVAPSSVALWLREATL